MGDSSGSATIQSSTGQITLTGTGQATGSSNEGIEIIEGSLVSTSSTEGILVRGTGSEASGLSLNEATIASLAGGDIVLEANAISLNNDNTFRGNGTGNLILKPIVFSDPFTHYFRRN